MRIWTAGIFSLVVAGSIAEAADFESRISPTPLDWGGLYMGISLGHGWLRDIDYSFTPPLRSSGEDVIFGFHFGYLRQFGAFVVGAEGEFIRLDINFEGYPIDAEESFSAKARGGFAFHRFMATGHAGAVHAKTNIGLEDWGWVVGAGMDYAITDNVIAGVNYDHMWFDRFDGTLIDARLDLLKARVTLKF